MPMDEWVTCLNPQNAFKSNTIEVNSDQFFKQKQYIKFLHISFVVSSKCLLFSF